MAEFAKLFESVWVWLQPVLSLLVVLIILAFALRTAWEQLVSQMLIEPLVKAVTGQPWYIAFMAATKKLQPALIAISAVYISLTAHLDLSAVFGTIIPVNLADDTTRQIASGLVWAVSTILLHVVLPAAKNASNASGGSSGLAGQVG